MKKPISLKINDLLSSGKRKEAQALALEAHKKYPKVTLYEQLVQECNKEKSPIINSEKYKEDGIGVQSFYAEVDHETLEHHLKNTLEKVRLNDISAVEAWNEISFLAPPSWSRDPRLTRVLTPKASALKQLDKLKSKSDNSILIVSGNLEGGAGIAALRIFHCLNSIGQEADILYRDGDSIWLKRSNGNTIVIETDYDMEEAYDGLCGQLIEELRSHVANETHHTLALKGKGSNTFLFHSEETLDISKISNYYKAINIHWTDFLLTSVSLERLTDSEIPITITLHDMYWITGTCHYSAGCMQFLSSCQACPLVTKTSNPITLFNSYHANILCSLKNLAIISPSEWLCELAAKSKSLAGVDTFFILNPQQDKANQKPSPKSPNNSNSITLIYGASGLAEKRKGYDLFVTICKQIAEDHRNVQFKVFGTLTAEQEKELRSLSCEILGFLNHKELAAQFTASDAMLLISHEDNYPNLCVEAAAQGLPVIASENSGLRSFIEASGGGLLVANHAQRIIETISMLTKKKLHSFGTSIYAWYESNYNNTTLEEAYRSVIMRSADYKNFVYDASIPADSRLASHKKPAATISCEYITSISEYAIELLVPSSRYFPNKFDLSYTLQQAEMPQLDLYIDGFLHNASAKINSDRCTFIVANLPTGKPVKLACSDSSSGYYYKKINVSTLSVYPRDLSIKRNSGFKAAKHRSCERDQSIPILVCSNNIAFEQLDDIVVYWLMANQEYSVHFPKIEIDIPKSVEQKISHDALLVLFKTVDLRESAFSQVKLVINHQAESIEILPTIGNNEFTFTIDKHLLCSSNSVFLKTGAGEMLGDGREIVALVQSQFIKIS